MNPSENEPGARTVGKSIEDADYTMLSRRWNGVELITQETALYLARRVHADTYGATDLAANEPLEIVEDGRVWVVTGAKPGPRITVDQPLDVSRIEDFPFAMQKSRSSMDKHFSYLLV